VYSRAPQVVNEARILKLMGNRCMLTLNLKNLYFVVGYPKLYWYGREGDYNLMVIELLGDNLEDLMKNSSGKRFSVLTVLNIAD
jgi:hypothetical protein